MNGRRKAAGFTLFELILFIVVTSISLAGIIPLYNNVLTGLQVVDELTQAEYLGLEMVETLRSVYNEGIGYANLIEANFPSELAINIGGTYRFDRFVQIEGMIPGLNPGPCTGLEYNGEPFKCLTVSVKRSGSDAVLFQERLFNTDLSN
ncbi:MAG: type II secretion system protein [Magnetococcales bacterium]|nr:type II secretion system protein [Magnetococcales bacterium]